MDVITAKVNLVIEPVDGFTGGRELQGSVTARTSDNQSALKKDGCFVFFNKPHGEYKITLSGARYLPVELTVTLDDAVQTMTVTLMPSRSYRFPRTATTLGGKAKIDAEIGFIYSDDRARVLGGCKRGDTRINLFFSEKDPPRLDRRYSLGGASYFLKPISGAEYELDRPAERDIDRSSTIGVCFEAKPPEYFAAANGVFKTAEIISANTRKAIELNGENTEYDIE